MKKTAKKTPKRTTRASAKKTPAARRADYGAPIDGFFAKQPPHLRAILDQLRAMVDAAAPKATGSIKWGMPFYTLDGQMFCALAGFKSHVNLILAGPPSAFADPEGRLAGDGKGGRHLKLRSVEEIPRAKVRDWLRAAAKAATLRARAQRKGTDE